jgi:glycosyltransferase involved in cell wall biosynthesis
MKVSVIVTTYNHENYIAQAIESVLAQEVSFDYEVIIGEDCSTDGTRAMVLELQQRHPDRIRLLLPDRNLGFGGNIIFIRILQMAQGEYLAFLDGDDYWTSPHKLQRQVDFLDQHSECAMCFHNTLVSYEDDPERPSWKCYPHDQDRILTIEDVLVECSIQCSTQMVRRTVCERLSWFSTVELDKLNDRTMAILTAQHGMVGYRSEVMGVYRQHDAGYWSRQDITRQLEQIIDCYEWINRHFKFRYDELMGVQISRRYYEASLEYEEHGDLNKAGACLRKCLAARPKWLEQYVPQVGFKGVRVWRSLDRKLWLYGHPTLYYLLASLTPLARKLFGYGISVCWFFRTLKRFVFRESLGFIAAFPNPTPDSGRSGMGATTLSWISLRTEAVEVRLGAPDGPLFNRSGPYGSAATGDWVHDGMVFYLQDVSGGKPLTPANTLDVIQVRVVCGRGSEAKHSSHGVRQGAALWPAPLRRWFRIQ